MNRYAYLTTGLAIKAISELAKTDIYIHGKANIPQNGAIIYVINHFTRIETLFLPYHIHKLTSKPVWSLADAGLFIGSVATFLDKVGAVSTKNPDRDLLIVKSLLTGEASWIIFPEGRMVKSKKILDSGQKKNVFMVASPEGKHPPRTGAAALALRTEFYRERIRYMLRHKPEEVTRLQQLFQIPDIDPVTRINTYLVPVNITYYPIRTKENLLSKLADSFIEDIPERMKEEIMTEGTMLMSGVDVDIRFGEPINIKHYVKSSAIQKDIRSEKAINFDDQIRSKKTMRKSAIKITDRLMSSIYSMTTINSDHLFASILRYMPLRNIHETDLKNRVYLAAEYIRTSAQSIYHHTSLDKSQIHLLTDDRYNQCKNFITLAIEKGILDRKQNVLIKDERFSPAYDFHTARITNPIEVITNEIEPLSDLQNHLKELAQQPKLRISYWTKKHIMDKMLFEFERDYTNFFIDGESKNMDVGRPFLLNSLSKHIGILLIHGYMAAPLEVKQLALYLQNKGYRVYVPRLKGHGTSPDDLMTRSYKDWIETVEEGYAIVRNSCEKVIVGGFSTGAGLALDIVNRVDDAIGVFAISPPMKLQDISSKLVPAVNTWNFLMSKVKLNAIKKEFIVNNPENPHINYTRNSIAALRELYRLMVSIEPKLSSITIPALVIQSHGDPVVNPEGSRRIFMRLGSKDKEYLLLNFDRHGILLGEGAQRVYKAVGDFIYRLAAT